MKLYRKHIFLTQKEYLKLSKPSMFPKIRVSCSRKNKDYRKSTTHNHKDYIRMDGYVTKTSFGKTLSAELDFFVLLMCFPGKYQEGAPLKNVETT